MAVELGEVASARIPADMMERLKATLAPREKVSDFFRRALDRELREREQVIAEEQRKQKIADISTWIGPARSSGGGDDFGRA